MSGVVYLISEMNRSSITATSARDTSAVGSRTPPFPFKIPCLTDQDIPSTGALLMFFTVPKTEMFTFPMISMAITVLENPFSQMRSVGTGDGKNTPEAAMPPPMSLVSQLVSTMESVCFHRICYNLLSPQVFRIDPGGGLFRNGSYHGFFVLFICNAVPPLMAAQDLYPGLSLGNQLADYGG